MSVLDVTLLPRLPGLAVSDRPEDLALIHRPDAAAAVWARRPAPAFQAWIDALDPALLPRGRVMLRPHVVPDMMGALCGQAGTPEGAMRAALIDDIAAQAQIMADLMGVEFVTLRLEVVTGDACRRFHTDMLRARLICTYRGPGTQIGTATGAGEDVAQVHDLPTGAVMVMRGQLWPHTPASGFRHRSPPIAGRGLVRHVLVIDPVADPAGDPA